MSAPPAGGRPTGSPELPELPAAEAEVRLSWRHDGGALRGWIEVRNAGGRTCRVSGKPSVVPLAATDGARLPLPTVVTLEFRPPGHVTLAPGASARAPVTWWAWSGPAAGNRVVVGWADQEAVVEADVQDGGAPQPDDVDGPQSASTSWFDPVGSPPG